MAEYIEREQALDVINLADFIADEHGLLLYADSVQACLLDIPSADVIPTPTTTFISGLVIEGKPTEYKPVVHGHWIRRVAEVWKKDGGKADINVYADYCSECGSLGTKELDNYCPNCGADMRGESDG